MTRRTARNLISLYPRSWRARYGEEFEEFLTCEKSGLREAVNVAFHAVRERVSFPTEIGPASWRRSLVWMAYACLAAALAGVNLWWTVDDTPLVRDMDRHAVIAMCWAAMEAGSAAMVFAALACGLPTLTAAARFALKQRRRDILIRLAVPPCIVATLAIWALSVATGSHWLPTPWDVTGDWIAPASWPLLSTRWALGTVTAALILGALTGTAICVRGVLDRTPLSEDVAALPRWAARVLPSRLIDFAIDALACLTALLWAAVTAWGVISERYDPAAFHSRFGFFGVSTAVSWAVSVGLFLAAAVAASRGAILCHRNSTS